MSPQWIHLFLVLISCKLLITQDSLDQTNLLLSPLWWLWQARSNCQILLRCLIWSVFNPTRRDFTVHPLDHQNHASFYHMVLPPIYKIYNVNSPRYGQTPSVIDLLMIIESTIVVLPLLGYFVVSIGRRLIVKWSGRVRFDQSKSFRLQPNTWAK